PGVCVPGLHLGGGRCAPPAHGPWGGREGTVKLLALGIDHRSAPAAIREALAFDGRKGAEGLAALARTFPGHEFVVLSTCDRVEGQILGQVKDAYKAAVASQTAGPILHTVFREALRVGKKVREATGMDRGKLSVASVAVDVAREVFDTFADKTVLVIGAGKMGDLTLQHLKVLDPGRILVTNRSPERAEAAAARWGGRAVPFD